MKLEYSTDFEDMRFVLRCLNADALFERVECGVRLLVDKDVYEGLDDVLSALYKYYEPECGNKKVKEVKRLRKSPETKKVEISIAALISLYHLHRLMVVDGTLKNKSFIEQMTTLINPIMQVDSDFQLLDIQVGEVIAIEDAPGLDKLYSEDVMVTSKIRVLSGLREHVSKDEMLNGKFLFVTNMKPAKFRGLSSEGMIICTRDEDGKVEPLKLPQTTRNGCRLGLEGHEVLLTEFSPAKVDMRKSGYGNVLKSFMIKDHFLTFKGTKVTCDGRYIQTKTANGPIS